MKRILAMLMGILLGATPAVLPRAAAEAAGEAEFVYTVLAPDRYDYLTALSDLAVRQDRILTLGEGVAALYRDAPDADPRRTEIASDVVAVAFAGSDPATLAADGTITVHTATPAAVAVPGAIDFCFAGGTLFALTEEALVRMPYGEAGFEPERASAPLAVTRGVAQRLAADETLAAVVAEDHGEYRLYTLGVAAAEETWDTIAKIEYAKDLAVVNGRACYLSEANSALRVSLADPKVDFELTAGAYHEGGCFGAARIAADGAELLIAGASVGVAAVNRYRFDFDAAAPQLRFTATVLASQDSAPGYFYLPEAALPYGAGTLIADTGNNRVQYLTADAAATVADGLNRPFALAAAGDSFWVIDQDGARITRYDRGGDTWIAAARIAATRATDLTVRGDGTLLFADDGVLRTADGVLPTAERKPLKIAANDRSTDVCYLTRTGELRRLDAAGEDVLLAADAGFLDLDVDAAGKVYALSGAAVTVVDGDTVVSRPLKPAPGGYAQGAASSIAIAAATHPAGAGALIIASAAASVVRTVSGADSEAVTDDWSGFVPPVDPDDAGPAPSWSAAWAAEDTLLYAYPALGAETRAVAADTPIFLLSDAAELGFFAQVAVEFPGSAEPEWQTGFVLRRALRANPAPEARPFEEGYLLHRSSVYKYPSTGAVRLGEYDKGTEVVLRAMPPVVDTLGREWVAIPYGEGIAYLPRQNVLKRHYSEPVAGFRTNASISAKAADVYTLRAGGDDSDFQIYTKIDDVRLAKGTRVMIVGSFDANADMTRIRYVDPEFGVLDGYVETGALEPDRFGTVEAVAAALLVMTLVIGVVLVSLRHKSTLN